MVHSSVWPPTADVRARLRGARSWRGADVRATVHSPMWPPTADVRAVAVAAGTNLGGGARAPPGRCRVRRSVLVQDPLGLVRQEDVVLPRGEPQRALGQRRPLQTVHLGQVELAPAQLLDLPAQPGATGELQAFRGEQRAQRAEGGAGRTERLR